MVSTPFGGYQGRPMSLEPNEAAEVMVTIRKVFTASTITIDQEKKFLAVLRRASSVKVADDAVDRMWNEGVKYPDGRDLRLALEAEERKTADQAPLDYGPGPFITFRDWFALQDQAMQDRVRRVFPGLRVEEWSA